MQEKTSIATSEKPPAYILVVRSYCEQAFDVKEGFGNHGVSHGVCTACLSEQASRLGKLPWIELENRSR
jgi:hypothetical protein